jgi:hypothetical protein
MTHHLARLSQHFLFLPFTTKALRSTRLLSGSGKHKPMSDEVGEARKAAAKQMEKAADAGTVSHRERAGMRWAEWHALFKGRIWCL